MAQLVGRRGSVSGAAWLSWWGGVAQFSGAAWLSWWGGVAQLVGRRGSVVGRRGSVGGAAWLSWWGGVAQLAARRLAVRQARVRFSARPHREVFPTEHTSDFQGEGEQLVGGCVVILLYCTCAVHGSD